MLRAILTRTAGFGLAWWVLSEGDPSGLLFGALVTAAAVAASLYLVPAGQWRWRLSGLVAFLPFFARLSVLGGIDVATRALKPGLPLDPAFLEYPLRLPSEPARVFFANTVSLLPGTVSVELRENVLRLHALDQRLPIQPTLAEVERRVAHLFGLELDTEKSADRSGSPV